MSNPFYSNIGLINLAIKNHKPVVKLRSNPLTESLLKLFLENGIIVSFEKANNGSFILLHLSYRNGIPFITRIFPFRTVPSRRTSMSYKYFFQSIHLGKNVVISTQKGLRFYLKSIKSYRGLNNKDCQVNDGGIPLIQIQFSTS